ncbi:MAG: acyl-CoA thioesterase [Draconibacterium sp.]|nr:acyl-CoA thioesterase [Draconibacterium sp.]
MKRIFKYEFQVRGYELDSFGHVNNAVYLNYLEQARWEIVQKLGVLELLKKNDCIFIVVETSIRYVNELNIFDVAFVETELFRKGFLLSLSTKLKPARQKLQKHMLNAFL